MGSWCFVHAADLHLDTPFEGIGQVDEHLAARLRDSSLAAFDRLVAETIDRDAAFLVVAGDVYDGPERGLRAQLRFERGLRRLDRAGIATFVAHGNHDPVATGWQLVTAWPDRVRVFGADAVESVDVRRDGRVVAVVAGVSYAERAERRNLARLFRRTSVDALHVGVLHANVGAVPEHDPYAPCSLEDLRAGGMDYWALGHVHRRRVLLDGADGGPWAVYPGNLQGRSVRATERGPKGASVVHVRDGAVERVEHVTLDQARFGVVDAQLERDTTVGAVAATLAAGVRAAAVAAGERVLVVRLELQGSGRAHGDLVRPGAREELLAAVRDEVAHLDEVVVTGVEDRSSPLPSSIDPRLVELVAQRSPASTVGDAATAARERGWTTSLPSDQTLTAAARAAALSHLAGST